MRLRSRLARPQRLQGEKELVKRDYSGLGISGFGSPASASSSAARAS
jgi:hypothetical protein